MNIAGWEERYRTRGAVERENEISPTPLVRKAVQGIPPGRALDHAVVADLKMGEYMIEPEHWNLIAICYYLQRDLMEAAKRGVRAGGLIVVVVHTTEPGEEPTESRLRPGELGRYFEDWEVLHRYEGKPDDPEHKRAVAEIVARKRDRSV